jgi:hypothetical protein
MFGYIELGGRRWSLVSERKQLLVIVYFVVPLLSWVLSMVDCLMI